MYSHIIWDFNGTIFDDVQAAIDSGNALLKRRNMALIENCEYYRRLFCFPVVDFYKKLGHDFEKESYDNVAVEWVEQYLHFSEESGLHDGVIDMLLKVKAAGIHQIVLSATEQQMLTMQLTELGVASFFDEILGLDNIYAYSKVGIAKKWIIRAKPQKALFIGDTVHDFEVATEIGTECILIANGHQSKDSLKACGVPVYNNIRELLNETYILMKC